MQHEMLPLFAGNQSDEDSEGSQIEVFYTEGDTDLWKAREGILKYSIPMSQIRLRQSVPDEEYLQTYVN